jgi:hypothetical protein
VSSECLIAQRRLELVALVQAVCAPHEVCDDIPDIAAGDVAIVVTWVRTRWVDHQWLHTYEVWIVPTVRTAGEFFATRDQYAGRVLTVLNAAQGLTRPEATTRTIEVGPTPYPNATVITIAATDGPISSGA